MRVNEYGTILDKDSRHTILVKEKGFNYNYSENKFNSPDIIVDMMNSVYGLNGKAEEYLYMLAFDTQFHLLGVFEVSHGSVNKTVAGAGKLLQVSLIDFIIVGGSDYLGCISAGVI